MQEVDEFVASMTSPGTAVPSHGWNSSLRISRNALVRKVIETVEDADQQVYIRGAAGTGKTVLLEQIAVQLKKEGKRAIFFRHPKEFADCWAQIQELTYVLVDEAHNAAKDAVWMYLKSGQKKIFYTIAAGIPGGEHGSAIFSQHIEVGEMLLTIEDLLSPSVVEFYTNRFRESWKENIEESKCDLIVRKVLQFCHKYTSGHSFPCLKMVEFFVTVDCEHCLNAEDIDIALTQSILSTDFEPVYRTIYNRCYNQMNGTVLEKLASVWWDDQTVSSAVLNELGDLGLWLKEENHIISLFVQLVILKKIGSA